ncbi:nodulation protein h [Leptolyngbya sp. Heron Island J]|uniref:nodulation protein h n=1 Tax=Leptolyngbya sp. Heron Island J TaxID=1385935 RepID=UPI0003B9A370|nr:nodulation protein h [Leptolyngbya sp. Heron Island J]ESA32253.1 nodulation protein h [Leptolyngbya sp. Heron Island J]
MPSTYYSSWFTHQFQGLISRGDRSHMPLSHPTHRFVLFGAEFTGARLVTELLRRVAVDAQQSPLSSTWAVASLLEQRHFFPLRHIQRQEMASSECVFGFKLSATDLMTTHRMSEPSRFIAILHGQGYRVIHLQRRDLMRHAIAVLKARQPHSRHLNPSDLIATLKHLDEQRIAEAAIVSQVPHLTITYETDLIDPNVHDATAQRLCSFLALKHQRVTSSIKLVHQRISDLIANYDEVRSTLEHSDYAYVLNEATAKLVV